MRKLVPIFLCVLLAVACSDDYMIIGGKPAAHGDQPAARYSKEDFQRVVRKARDYFVENDRSLPFMRNRHLRFIDVKYGLARRYSYKGGFVIEIPVVNRPIKINTRKDWMRGRFTRSVVRLQYDDQENIININYINQIPTKEYYASHTTATYFDHLVGREDYYDKDDNFLGSFYKRSAKEHKIWKNNTKDIYPGDSIKEVVFPY